jgi:predicted nucleic acid-binding protein
LARTWGEISAYAAKRGRPRPVNDTWIAACCLTFDLPLATLNVGDFQDFVDHEGLVLITP